MSSLSAGISGGEFSIGTLISATFTVVNRGLPKFIALSIIPIIPNVILLIVFGARIAPADANTYGIINFVASLASAVLLFMIQGAIVFGATNEMRGRSFSVGEALSKGLARFVPLFGVSLVTGLLIMIGLVLLIVPGLYLICLYYAAAAVCVVEHLGVFASMSRSVELTRGYRWKIFALVLIVGLASAAISFLLALVGRAVGGPIGGIILSLIIQLYTSAFGSVLVALTYYSLRSIKEGIDIDRIADVFN